MLFEKGSSGLLGAVVVFAGIGVFFGWGPLKGLHDHWTGKSDKPAVTEAEKRLKASRDEAERQAKAAAERARLLEEPDALTLDNFEERFRSRVSSVAYQLEPFKCGPDAFNPGGTYCFSSNFRVGRNGSMLFIRSGSISRSLTRVGFMIGNPELMREPARSEMQEFYRFLSEHMINLIDPRLTMGTRESLLKRLQSGLGPDHRETTVTIGPWEYIGESGPVDWAFAVKRK